MDYNFKKEKTEISYRLERIHSLQEDLDRCLMNLTNYDNVVGKFNYEIAFNLLKIISEEIVDLEKDEIAEDLAYRKEIQTFLLNKDKPIFKVTYQDSYYSKPKRFKELVLNNFLELEALLSKYHRFIKDLVANNFKKESYTDRDDSGTMIVGGDDDDDTESDI